MSAAGLVGVPDPSELFGSTHPGEIGAAVGCALEGTRPMLLEVQALVAPTDLAMPRRVGTGVDPRRLAMIVAVLGRHAGVALASSDVFVNVAGGVKIEEPGADLAVALAIASAARGAPVREGLAAFGEIGLTGRLRTAAQAERRLDECAKLGLATVLAPAGTSARDEVRVTVTETLRDAVGARERFVFLAVGGVEPRKGSKTLFSALGLLRERGRHPVLAIVGGHSFRDYEPYREEALALRGCLDGVEIRVTNVENDPRGWWTTLRDLVDRLFEGSTSSAVLQLLETSDLDAKEREHIRQLIERKERAK